MSWGALLQAVKTAEVERPMRSTRGKTYTLTDGTQGRIGKLAKDPRNVHSLPRVVLRGRLERGDRAPEVLYREPEGHGPIYTLDDGTQGYLEQLLRDARNVHNVPSTTLQQRLRMQTRDPERLYRKPRQQERRPPFVLTDGTTGHAWVLRKDPRNVHSLHPTTIDDRLGRGMREPEQVFAAPTPRGKR